MKLLQLLVLVFITFSSVNAQHLTLNDLHNICNKTNWEYVNQYLINKGWEYYDSEKGSSTKYNTITWSYNKSYGNKAEAWFYIYTYEELPQKINYSVFNKPAYSLIQNALGSNGYKLTASNIEDNEIVTTYLNNNFILKVTTGKRDNNDDYKSITSYSFLLIKKTGIYDSDNGNKIDYWSGSNTIEAEYSLKDGKLNGKYTSYNINGSLKKTGNYLNGIENGLFKNYNEKGQLISEYYMKNGETEGPIKIYYENGQLKESGNYVNGLKNGHFEHFDEEGWMDAAFSVKDGEIDGLLITFNEKKLKTEENEYKNGVLNGSSKMFFYNQDEKITGIQKSEYKNGIKNGKTELLTIEDGNKERSLSFTNFINGIKDGDFQEIKGDSLIIGTYKNDKLNGKYKVYVDVAHMLIGGIIKTDTSDLIILTDGNYIDGLKSGNWKIYDLTSTLKSAGNYSNNKKTGVWSYYYSKYGSLYDAPEVYSGKLYLTETYENGLKNGESIRYSSLEDIKVLCDTMESRNFNPRDTCYKKVFNKEYQSLYLKNDELHGPCLIKDSTGIITFQGNFILGKKNGEWLESYVNELIDNKPFYIFEKGSYKEGKRIGNWKEFANEDFIWNISNYTDGKLNGKYTSFYKNGNPQEIKQFVNGYLKEVIIYDSIGVSLIRKYDILEETDSYLKIRKTSYEKRFITSYDYWIKNDDDMSNHNFFELMFDVKTSNALKGIHSYYDGEVKITDQNGQIILKGNMHKEDMIGVWEYYYPDQNVQINVIYLENKPALEKYLIMSSKELFNGIFTYLDTEKNIREERKIKNGLKNGTTQFYDENNKKIRSEKYKDGIIQ